MTKAQLEAAYRARQGIIGILQSCWCMWPLEKLATETEHLETCPAHAILLRERGIEPRLRVQPFSAQRAPGGWRGRCPRCSGVSEVVSSIPELAQAMATHVCSALPAVTP